ncbi:MAG: hypothetical protein K2Y71_10290 [Xanthobacteraceae bacterium]|nr:hypothetical protein [Xanthobacteraceae bacterium]
MQRRKPAGIHPQWRIPEPLLPDLRHVVMVGSAALPLLLLASLLPRPLVLPVLCLIAIAGAGVAAFVAWQRNSAHAAHHVTGWDVSGALAFVACAAAIFSHPEHLIHLAETMTTANLNK